MGAAPLCCAGIPLCSIACCSVGRDVIDAWNVVGMDGVVLPADEGGDELNFLNTLVEHIHNTIKLRLFFLR